MLGISVSLYSVAKFSLGEPVGGRSILEPFKVASDRLASCKLCLCLLCKFEVISEGVSTPSLLNFFCLSDCRGTKVCSRVLTNVVRLCEREKGMWLKYIRVSIRVCHQEESNRIFNSSTFAVCRYLCIKFLCRARAKVVY